MSTVQGTAKLLKLKAQFESLTPGDRLRVCAGLIDEGQYDIAETLLRAVLTELQAVRLLGRKR